MLCNFISAGSFLLVGDIHNTRIDAQQFSVQIKRSQPSGQTFQGSQSLTLRVITPGLLHEAGVPPSCVSHLSSARRSSLKTMQPSVVTPCWVSFLPAMLHRSTEANLHISSCRNLGVNLVHFFFQQLGVSKEYDQEG